MKFLRLLLPALFSASALAQAPAVSPELVGTWATARIDCERPGPSTLTVTTSGVTRFNVRGTISGSRVIGRRTLEVLFDPMASGAHALGVRFFVLSTDGAELHEMEAGKVVMSRRRCESGAS